MNRLLSNQLLAGFTVLILAIPLSLAGQIEGCTDPQATNYDPEATQNDGSCFYPETFFTPDQYLVLPSTLDETSGLIYWAGGIWTFNDSGGDPRVYKVDTVSGEIIQHVTLANGDNVDWEDIAQDDDHIYIGDFGNNGGNRKDLLIYKIAKADIPPEENVEVNAEIISFEYADQQSFTTQFNAHEYDCEAMISAGGMLYLFTKNWLSETTRLYELSTEAGSYSILPIDTLNASGLVTGAAYSNELRQVVLSGYSNFIPFIFLLFDYQENSFFSGNKRRIGLTGMIAVQTEGICFKEGYRTFLSCEKSAVPQQLYTFSTEEWTYTASTDILEHPGGLSIEVIPNPVAGGNFEVLIHAPVKNTCQLNLYDSSGKVVFNREYALKPGGTKNTLQVRVPEINPGIYILHILSGEFSAIEKIAIQ